MKLPRAPSVKVPEPSVPRALFHHPECMLPEQAGKYLHWEELRHRPPPEGITSETWWWGVRLSRRQLARPLGLRDQKGTRFTFSMTDSAQRLVHEIDRDASGHIALPEDVTSPGNRNRYIVNSLIEEAFRSSQLEGASTTRRVAKEMIHTKRKPRTRQLAVLNDALQHPDTRITIEGHRALSRVVYQTARTDLLRLAALGYLDQLKVGKKLYFVPRPDLARKLKLLK